MAKDNFYLIKIKQQIENMYFELETIKRSHGKFMELEESSGDYFRRLRRDDPETAEKLKPFIEDFWVKTFKGKKALNSKFISDLRNTDIPTISLVLDSFMDE